MKMWNFGIIGAGLIADFHAKAIQSLSNASLTGICGTNPYKAMSLSDKYKCKTFSGYEEMLRSDEIDIVVTDTPSGAHMEPTIEAARCGKHVICEKPLEMKQLLKVVLITCIACIFLSCNNGNISRADKEKQQVIWDEIGPFFSPPAEYQKRYGDYRTPLKFYDGRPVVNQEDWMKRRKEILDRWNEMMGQWPPLVKNQEMEVLETIEKEGFTQQRIRFSWLPGETTEGYLLIPEGKGKKPAVITVYYEPETAIGDGKPYRDFAYQLAKRGFVTLSIGTAATTNAKTYSLYYPNVENSQIQPLSVLACAAANSWTLLSERDDVDSDHIGIVGHSYGGKWAMFASCLFDKFACAAWSDPGIVFDESRSSVNYWEPWYLGYYPPPWENVWRKTGLIQDAKGLYPKLVDEGYDLHELHALMAPRPFLVSGGAEDTLERWIPLNHTVAINRLLGIKNRIAMTNRAEHSPNNESNEQIYLFFEYFLKYNGDLAENQCIVKFKVTEL